jgi:hypothetical protein
VNESLVCLTKCFYLLMASLDVYSKDKFLNT